MGLLTVSVRNEVKDSVFQGETSEETCQPVENCNPCSGLGPELGSKGSW